MTTQVEATWSDGVLKPDERVPLPEQTRVRLTIEPIEKHSPSTEAWASLKQWIRENPLHGLGRRLTRDELHERR
jgi:predicted DNA-binding antitoxin AbrB/MazE fold protein